MRAKGYEGVSGEEMLKEIFCMVREGKYWLEDGSRTLHNPKPATALEETMRACLQHGSRRDSYLVKEHVQPQKQSQVYLPPWRLLRNDVISSQVLAQPTLHSIFVHRARPIRRMCTTHYTQHTLPTVRRHVLNDRTVG